MSDSVLISIITALATLISSGFLTYYISKRKVKIEEDKQNSDSGRTDFTAINNVWKDDNNRLRAEIDKFREELRIVNEKLDQERQRHREEIDEMRRRIKQAEEARVDLANKITLFETSHHDLPLPQWLKDRNGVMLSVNDAYVDTFLEPIGKGRSDYVGHTDTDVWGAEIAQTYRKNDTMVHSRRRPMTFKEKITVGANDLTEEFIVMKYPRFLGRTLIGIGGICFPVSYYHDTGKK